MPIIRTSLAEQARNALLENIVAGRLSSGDRLTEEALSMEFGISRTPVREALSRLEADGLIERLNRGGYQVKKLEAEAVEELLNCRLEVELKIFEEYYSNLPLDSLRALYDELLSLDWSSQDAFAAARRIDDALHGAINGSCVNRYWRNFHKKLLQQRLPYRDIRNTGTPEHLQQLKEERRRLLEAILSGDRQRGSSALREHLENGRQEVLAVLNSNIA